MADPTHFESIEDGFYDGFGQWQTVSNKTKSAILRSVGSSSKKSLGEPAIFLRAGESLPWDQPGEIHLEDGLHLPFQAQLPNDLPIGYHSIHSPGQYRRLFVSPERCFLPDNLRAWGWSCQVYALRSPQSWGIGDFADLATFSQLAKAYGATVLQTNPLAAVAPVAVQEDSPYSPTSRRFLNPIYLRVEEVAKSCLGIANVHDVFEKASQLNQQRIICRDEVFRFKMEILSQLWEDAILDLPFREFCSRRGEALEQFATFCVLAEQFGRDYRQWPGEYRRPELETVAEFKTEHWNRVRFFQWLQWHSYLQLSRADDCVDLVNDLPIGFDPGGFDAWEWQDIIASNVSIGAPPDAFNREGQNWGIPPIFPHKLRESGYESLISTIRASMELAGGLRIDHIMGFFRLYWIPNGLPSSQGAYVAYPSHELLAILAIESQRAGCWIAGEDLGTVPAGMREELNERNILTHRLALFADEHPADYPRKTIASISTHDLPTLAGLFSGAEEKQLKKIGRPSDSQHYQDMKNAIQRIAKTADDVSTSEVIAKTYASLSNAGSAVVLASIEDATQITERPNLPGTTSEWPNWKLKIPVDVTDIPHQPLFKSISNQMRSRTK